MTEEAIERRVQSKMDALDRRFLSTHMTQAEYDAEVDELNNWADGELRTAPLTGR